MGDIDEATFTNVMAFGLDELHELRTLEPEGCGSRLYELANGLDRSRVARTIYQIEEAVQRLAQGDGQKTPRQLLLEKRDALRKAEDEHQSEYYVGDLFIEHTKIRREITSLEKAVTRATATESLARWTEGGRVYCPREGYLRHRPDLILNRKNGRSNGCSFAINLC